jgi:drug/metabolite transporter (DMT)-like permease
MPIFAIALLIGSAFLHTAWNLLLKQAGDKFIVTWWATLLGAAIFMPLLFFTGLPPHEVWPLLLASILAEAGYYITLAMAYRDADFSLVYPLARGAAPGLIATWSVLFLGEKLTVGGMSGLGIIVIGLFIVGGSNLFQQGDDKPHLRGVFLALTLAFIISIYSALDGLAIKHTSAIPYAVLVFLGPPLLTSPIMFRLYGWTMLKEAFDLNRVRLLVIGFLIVSAYILVLLVYAIAPVSYSGAVREFSVVLGALAGWRFLGERMGGWRVLGAIIIFAGILVIAVFG